jgi:transcriptional regulator with XRE-family HTH domain
MTLQNTLMDRTSKATAADFFFRHSVGKTLKQRRKQLGLSLHEVAGETRIRYDYLKSIEEGNFQAIPHTVHTLGFIRMYAKFLKLDSETAATKYLLERGPITPSNDFKLKRLRSKSAIVGSKLLTLSLIAVGLLAIGTYLALQLLTLVRPPKLDISQPAENQVITTREIEVTGATTPGAQVEVNGVRAAVEENGNFTAKLVLSSGINKLEIVSKNRRGKTTTLERTVLIETDSP